METITLTASLTYPLAQIEAFADNRGYQTKVSNLDYIPAQGNEFLYQEDGITDLLNEDGNPTPNPDYVAAVGENIIDNPQTRVEFVKEWFKKEAVELFAVDFKREAQKQAQVIAGQIEQQAKEALAQAITIE